MPHPVSAGNPQSQPSGASGAETSSSADLLSRMTRRWHRGGELSESELHEMLDVLQQAFDGWPSPDVGVESRALDYLRWKVEGPPGLETIVSLTRDDSRVVGAGVDLYQRAKVGREQLRIRWSTDTAVAPSYQRRGLSHWRRQVREAYERQPLSDRVGTAGWLLGTSSHPAVLHLRQPSGMFVVENEIQTLLRVFDLRRMLRRPTVRRRDRVRPWPLVALAYAATRLAGVLRHPPYLRPQRAEWSLRVVPRVDERIAGFYERASAPFEFIRLHDKSSFNWRYCDPRAGVFTVTLAEHDGELLGLLVRKTTPEVGVIADVLALPGRLDVVRSLVADALRAFREEGVAGVRCWLPARHPYQRVLRRHGFIDSQRPVGLVYRPIDDALDVNWLGRRDARIHLTYSHSDAL